MRKILLSAALAAICTMGMTAMASETTVTGTYIPGVNNYRSEGTAGSKTIIIYKVNETNTITGEDIFYVDQADTESGTFGTNVEALMKSGATAGEYVVATNEGETTFVISEGAAAVEGCTPTTKYDAVQHSDNVEYYSVPFIMEVDVAKFNAFKSVKSRVGDVVYSADIKSAIEWSGDYDNIANIAGGTNVKVGVQVDWVPSESVNVFELYFSEDAVASTTNSEA